LDLTLKALEGGGASTVNLPYSTDYNATKLGDYVGTLYSTILAKVQAAPKE
jgi:hypothetical protein